MKAVIDTSSLVSLVRYFLPFDKEGKLKAFLEENSIINMTVEVAKTSLF